LKPWHNQGGVLQGMIELPTDDNPVVIIHGDCLDILPQIPAGVVDAVVTDPPYGIAFDTNYKRFTSGFGVERTKHKPVENDDKPFDPKPFLGFRRVVMWGANCFSNRLPLGSWLIWDKRFPNGTAFLADAEAAWMNSGHGIYIQAITSQGFIRPEKIQHPTQKPVALMRWCIHKAGILEDDIILDPFAGSGTTGVAAILEGRKAILIEKDAGYVEVIKKRIAETLGRPTTLANGRTVGRNLFESVA